MRVIVTGSREHTDRDMIAQALDTVEAKLPARYDWTDIVLVHGAAPGADTLADEYAMDQGWRVERHPADWAKYGKRAGFVRNKEMADLGADLCLAFPIGESRGTRMMMDLVQRAGIRLEIWES